MFTIWKLRWQEMHPLTDPSTGYGARVTVKAVGFWYVRCWWLNISAEDIFDESFEHHRIRNVIRNIVGPVDAYIRDACSLSLSYQSKSAIYRLEKVAFIYIIIKSVKLNRKDVSVGLIIFKHLFLSLKWWVGGPCLKSLCMN